MEYADIRRRGGYIFKIRSLIVLQEYDVDRSSSGVRENPRNRLEPLTGKQVRGDAY